MKTNLCPQCKHHRIYAKCGVGFAACLKCKVRSELQATMVRYDCEGFEQKEKGNVRDVDYEVVKNFEVVL